MAMESEEALKVLALLTAAICIKFFFVILGNGGKRTRAPEDQIQFKKEKQPHELTKNNSAESDDSFDSEERWKRIVQNDMENIPITITLLWIAVFINGNNEVNIAFASIFLFGRTIHTISYIYGLQPWRTVGYAFAFNSTLGFIGNIIYAGWKQETDITLKIHVLTILTALIFVKFMFVILVSGVKRTRAPEDPEVVREIAKKSEQVKEEDGFDERARWRRIVQNDMENIPITITLLWIAVFINGNNETNVAFASLFLFGRTMHTISYMYGLQPWRTLGWFFGFIATLGFIGNMIYGAFQ